jgi:sulfite reductase beta subunit-like hemoprotein
MTQTQRRPSTKGVIEVLPEELNNFETQVKRFGAGEWEETEFQAFRLKQGIYGQRQPDAQMIRVKVPFGGLTADQLDALGVAAEKYAPLNKGHVTTRLNFQFHHVPIQDTPDFLRVIGEAGLTTREACGNTVRNVSGCALAGVCADEPFDVTPYAGAYARYFVRHPYTQALPRKFKTAFSGCERDCAITAIHDLGFIPKIQGGQRGFQMLTGGGTSIMPKLAPTIFEFVPMADYLKVSEAIIRIFHRSDELRKNRMKARIKFLIARIGIDTFRDMVTEELKEPWAERSFDPTPLLFIEDESKDAPQPPPGGYHSNGHLPEFERWLATNVHPQKQEGYKAVTVKLPLGDIDVEQFHQLADLSRKYAGGRARLDQQQNLVVRWVPEQALHEVWAELGRIGLAASGAHDISDVVACPGTDSCKLGITSSMGMARASLDSLSAIGDDDPLVKGMHIKVSGCPNGCAQHHIADIGLHGAAAKSPGGQVPAYELFLGGSYEDGDVRFGARTKTKVPAKRAPEVLKRVVTFYQENRTDGEPFKDFVGRVGAPAFEPLLREFKEVGELNRDTINTFIDWDKTVVYKLERGEGECAI